MNISENALNESSKKAISALSKVNDAFIRALQDDPPPSTSSTLPTTARTLTSSAPTPYNENFVSFINQTARNVLNETKKGQLNSKGWSAREELHQEIVNGTVDALNNHKR